jgi:hypothetical protein
LLRAESSLRIGTEIGQYLLWINFLISYLLGRLTT